MPNLLLTQRCDRNCPYCFAEDYMAETGGDTIRFDDFIYVLDFFQKHKIQDLSFLGGEPTTHPQILEILEYTLQRGFNFRMFTGVIDTTRKIDAIHQLVEEYADKRKIHFIININHPGETPDSHKELQGYFMERLGRFISLGFNLYKPDFDISFIFETVARYGLQNTLRLGVAHPILATNSKNIHVHPRQYKALSNRLAEFIPLLEKNKIALNFDCGFPICMFTDEQLGAMTKLKSTFNWLCGPIFDIGPDLDLWPCFPLSNIRGKTLYDFDDIEKIYQYLKEEVLKQRCGNEGIFLECDDCRYRERGLCVGGCISYFIAQA